MTSRFSPPNTVRREQHNHTASTSPIQSSPLHRGRHQPSSANVSPLVDSSDSDDDSPPVSALPTPNPDNWAQDTVSIVDSGAGGPGAILSPLGRLFGTELSINDRPPAISNAGTTGAKIRVRAARDDNSSSPGYGWSPTREPPMKKRPSIIGLRSGSGPLPGAMGPSSSKQQAFRPPTGMLGAGKLSAGPALGGSGSNNSGSTSISSSLLPGAPSSRPIRGLGKRSLSLAAGAGMIAAGSVFGPTRPIPAPLQSAGPFSSTFPENIIAAHELPTASGGRIPKSSSGPIPTTATLEAAAPSGSPDTSMMADGPDDGGEQINCVGDFSDFFNNPQSPETSFNLGNSQGSKGSASRSGSSAKSSSGSVLEPPQPSTSQRQHQEQQPSLRDPLADISGSSVLDGPAPARGPDLGANRNGLGARRQMDRRMPSLSAAFADRSLTESERSSSPLSSPLQGRQSYFPLTAPSVTISSTPSAPRRGETSIGTSAAVLMGVGTAPRQDSEGDLSMNTTGNTSSSSIGSNSFAATKRFLQPTAAAAAAAAAATATAGPSQSTAQPQRHVPVQNLQSPANRSTSSSDFNSPDAVQRFILPSEDGAHDRLRRLKPETMIQLLNGGFDEVVSGYTVIDCRYSYEYNGGHIPGAVNLRTVDEIKEYLLTPRSGLNVDSDALPPRTTTGKNAAHKHVLIFHCEFSQKRAPKMAAALRDIDRSLAQDWPRCHYPEIYILQGGYERFYKLYPAMCQPRCYVRELDPQYAELCKLEGRTFQREFMRHKSMPVPRRLQRTQSESAAAHMMLTASTMGGSGSASGLGMGMGIGLGIGIAMSGGEDDSSSRAGMEERLDDTPSRPPLARAAGSSMAVLGSSSASSANSSSSSAGTGTGTGAGAGRTASSAHRSTSTTMLGGTSAGQAQAQAQTQSVPMVSAPRFGSRAPGMGQRAATSSYVPMLCSAGTAMIREASKEGDASFSL
ncbi:m-phase inducer phosphatase [Tilletia horrida]|nr:m-phase inducer phosphatase [Tilletia horrida]